MCAEGGNEALVRLLVAVGADVNMSPSGELAVEHILAGQTPLYGAAKKGHSSICRFLIESGADVNAETMVSACGGCCSVASRLMAAWSCCQLFLSCFPVYL